MRQDSESADGCPLIYFICNLFFILCDRKNSFGFFENCLHLVNGVFFKKVTETNFFFIFT